MSVSDDDWDNSSLESEVAIDSKMFDIILNESSNLHLVEKKGMVLCIDRKSDDVLVRYAINTDHLNGQTALAWGIDKDVCIEITVDYGLDIQIKNIAFCGKVTHQIQNIARCFLDNKADLEDWGISCHDEAFSGNRLLKFISYMWFRFIDLHMHCMICDCKHDDGICMINPTVCMKPLCMYSTQLCKEFIEDFDLGGGIRGGQVKLLRLFFIIAAMSDRYAAILSPWPIIYANDQSILIDKTTPIEKLRDIVKYMNPDITKCVKCTGMGCIKCSLESWILSSNRSAILSLQDFQRSELFKTEHQYLLISNPPELEQNFQGLKKIHGSKFFYHGSPTDNWHSILRNGFFVASGSSMQLHGAAYGHGVYVAHQMDTAAGYTRVISRNLDGEVDKEFKMFFVAICEVIDNFDIVKDHGWCKVIPDASYIVPRFLLGYTAYPRGMSILDSTSELVHKWCVDTMDQFN
jgi:hypothetical protein